MVKFVCVCVRATSWPRDREKSYWGLPGRRGECGCGQGVWLIPVWVWLQVQGFGSQQKNRVVSQRT